MSLIKPLEEMDALVAAGKFHEAVERFFADHGKATSPGDDFQANNKEEKKASLSHFLQHIKHTNHITLHSQSENGNVSESAFTFNFTGHQDNPMVWYETIRRHWENGLVVLEEYIMMERPAEAPAPEKETLAEQKAVNLAEQKRPNAGAPETGTISSGKTESAAAITTNTTKDSAATPAAKKATPVKPAPPASGTKPVVSAAPAQPEPVKTTAPAVKTITPKSAAPKAEAPKKVAADKTDDLKRIEGIGPKIEELLKKAGIHTFTGLSEAPTEKLKGILDAAGPRFQMHEPATWPKQAKLAADGEWEKLKIWQDELKGGIVK